MLVYPTKLALAFPFVFHTLGGFRHIVWDKTTSGIDNESARASSLALFAVRRRSRRRRVRVLMRPRHAHRG